MHSSFSDAKLALAVVFTPHPPGAQQSSVLGMDVDLGHAMDDVDLAELTSPPRVNHRRVRSDPSDFMRSLRADRFPEDESGQSSKRELCADVKRGTCTHDRYRVVAVAAGRLLSPDAPRRQQETRSAHAKQQP